MTFVQVRVDSPTKFDRRRLWYDIRRSISDSYPI